METQAAVVALFARVYLCHILELAHAKQGSPHVQASVSARCAKMFGRYTAAIAVSNLLA